MRVMSDTNEREAHSTDTSPFKRGSSPVPVAPPALRRLCAVSLCRRRAATRLFQSPPLYDLYYLYIQSQSEAQVSCRFLLNVPASFGPRIEPFPAHENQRWAKLANWQSERGKQAEKREADGSTYDTRKFTPKPNLSKSRPKEKVGVEGQHNRTDQRGDGGR